jgi:D-sedoheptulose 7-phosphate isomerase
LTLHPGIKEDVYLPRFNPRRRYARHSGILSKREAAMTDNILRKNIESSIKVHSHLLEACLPAMTVAAGALIAAYGSGRKALFFGNGGSAADAQHLAAEFLGRYLRERRPMPAVALNDNTSAVTAIANDYGYEHVFSRQLQALAVAGDVAVGISTSGNSRSVLEALMVARKMGVYTFGLTGARLPPRWEYPQLVSREDPLFTSAGRIPNRWRAPICKSWRFILHDSRIRKPLS